MQLKSSFRLCTLCAISASLLVSCSNYVVSQYTPSPSDILGELFSKFGSRVEGVQGRVIPVEKLDSLYESIGLFNSSVADPHAGHDHFLRKRQIPERRVGPECILPPQLLEVYNITTPYVNETQFQSLTPGLIYLKISNACAPLAEESDNAGARKLTSAEVWIYSLLANLIVTLAAVFGLVLLPIIFRYPKYGKVVLLFMVGLGCGSLLSDALLHLIPIVLGVHSHGGDGHEEHANESKSDANPLFIMLLAVVGAYSFFLLERIINFVAQKLSPTRVDGSPTESNIHADNHHHHHHHPELRGQFKPVGFLVLIGDGFHNFVDGLAIGVSFAKSWKLGIGTSLAILLHEVTHELSDFAVLLSSGFSPLRAALYNVLSNLPSFLGCILVFLYIALADLIPILHEDGRDFDCVTRRATKRSLEVGVTEETAIRTELDEVEPCAGIFNKEFIAANFGIIVGAVAMVVLGLYEEKIKV
ncbi:ZIP zinc transporter-domain-containing protein [Paraphysoderma sedebokerense]|nr:ZIP zinc transporter-domain-containing protein [Paraphysoderma sedebokerense]